MAITRTTLNMKTTERMVANAGDNRAQGQLNARTREAVAAQRSASASEQAAAVARNATASAERNTTVAQRETQMAMARNQRLEMQMKELNAKATPRGRMITLEDGLFNMDQSTLLAQGVHRVGQLAAVLKEFPKRNALVEGFTASTGSAGHNLELSGERADTVRSALMCQGIAMERISARGYGETSPVASNDSAEGPHLNRRVEIVLSDDSGRLIAR
jgi:outer membrane protein OmpA-like peptidoglycan-associated protein